MVIKFQALTLFYHEIIINRSFLFLKLLDEKIQLLKYEHYTRCILAHHSSFLKKGKKWLHFCPDA